MKVFFMFLIALLMFKPSGNAQSYGFEDYNDCNWNWMEYKKKCLISFITEKGDKSLFIKYDNREALGTPNMEFSLSKNIILPLVKYHDIKIAVYTRNKSNEQISLIVIGIDNNENIILNKTVNLKGSLDWKELALKTTIQKIRSISIYIRYKGNADKNQFVGLKNIAILLDNKDIRKIKVANTHISNSTKLSPSYISPLNINTTTELFVNLPMIKNQKIIALGENTHGSETVSKNILQFLRTLIVNYNCKLILIEVPFDIGMLMNSYAQGLTANSFEVTIKDYANMAMDQETMVYFLNWLREYNQKALKKVFILGMDNSSASFFPLMDFHFELLGKEKSYPYLRKLYNEKNVDILEIAKEDTVLKDILGKLNYKYYRYSLSDRFSKDREDRFTNREENMANRVTILDTMLTKADEKIAILAHSLHIQKIMEITTNYKPVLGSILNTKYKENYFAVDFKFGQGTFSQDSCSSNVYVTIDTLTSAPKNSFEYAALKTEYPSFYYPAKYVNSNIYLTAYITRNSQNKDQFKFSDLKRRFDGYVFIKQGYAFPNAEKNPLKYSFKFYTKKSQQYEMLLKSMTLN